MSPATKLATLATTILLSFPIVLAARRPPAHEDPYGGSADVAFARQVGKAMAGYPDWEIHSDLIRGQSPHGKYVRMSSSWVRIDGRLYPMIVKDNFGGRGVTKDGIAKDPAAWRKSLSIMLQREKGYDDDNDNWFWAMYDPQGELMKNDDGVTLAGRIAKGEKQGCLSCHTQADGKDFLFSNDG